MKEINKIFLYLIIFCFIGCDDFLTGDLLDNDPNKVDDVSIVSVESLLVGSQVSMYGVMESYLNRMVTMIMQQMAGQKLEYYSDYNCSPIDRNTNGRWSAIYGTGGLIDLRTIQTKARDQEKYLVLGIAQMWEALIISTAADLWGSIPYSQSANSNYASPKLDSQREVHEEVLSLLSDAIDNFSMGQVQNFSSSYDFSFGGNINKWIAVANTLSARIYLNWAEVDGVQAYEAALFHAEQGVSVPNGTGDWRALHSTTNNEQSIWWQFTIKNNDYMGAGHLLVDMLTNDNDDRLNIYFSGNPVIGVKPGETQFYGSDLNSNTYGSREYGVEFISWYENKFIIAECQYNLGDQNSALSTLNSILDDLETKWQAVEATCTLPRYENIIGNDILKVIMNEKYKAMFLNIQTWSDWRRTGYPDFIDVSGESTSCSGGTPRRLLYPEKEKSTNPNCPVDDSIYDRVQNDPN